MPCMGGLEIVTLLSQTHPDLPIIMMTAYAEGKDVKAALESGLVKHCLSKPFSLIDLIDLLSTLDI